MEIAQLSGKSLLFVESWDYKDAYTDVFEGKYGLATTMLPEVPENLYKFIRKSGIDMIAAHPQTRIEVTRLLDAMIMGQKIVVISQPPELRMNPDRYAPIEEAKFITFPIKRMSVYTPHAIVEALAKLY